MRDLEWLEVASGCLVACLIHDDVGHTGTRPKLNRPTLVVLLMSRVSLRSAASRRCGMRSITISAIVELPVCSARHAPLIAPLIDVYLTAARMRSEARSSCV
ncbi:hypothetical protein ACVW0I_006777 [Bradyrhizobium sp. LM6.11]|jgi:hypothetical protein